MLSIAAEIGVNHDGSLDQAKRLIDAAKAAGATLAKFQTFSADRLAAQSTPKVPYQLRSGDRTETHHAMLQRLELSAEAHHELKSYCEQAGIEFCSTPYSRQDAAFLRDLGVKVIKVASADLVDRTLHEFLAESGCECVLATGMATLDEIEATMALYDAEGARNRVTLLQCTSAYPADPADANLLVLQKLRHRFDCRVGYSDHTPGFECAMAAVALGAVFVEKHLTIDKSLPGPDHAASATPEEFAEWVRMIRRVETALGDGEKRVSSSEMAMRKISRKSIVAARNLAAGAVLTETDLAFRRPGTGLSPMSYPALIGRTLCCSVLEGDPLQLNGMLE